MGHVPDPAAPPAADAAAGPPGRAAGLAAPGPAARRARLGGDRGQLAARPVPARVPPLPGLRRHVVVLARFAVLHVEAQQAATRRGLSEIRGDLQGRGRRGASSRPRCRPSSSRTPGCSAVRREVGLVEEALRGRRYRVRM